MGSAARQKGDLLEYAVLRIEETVLAQHPQFKGCDVTIERKKILVLQGVRHEIDLLVTINPQTNYPAQHIIECKNWKAPVGTAEVASLAIKREAVRASSASLIAPVFTKDARALADIKDIKLFEVEDAYVSLTAPFFTYTTRAGSISARYHQATGPQTLSWETTRCDFFGHPTFLGAVMDMIIQPQLVAHASETDGPQVRQFSHSFGRREFLIEGYEVSAVEGSITFIVESVLPTVTTNLSIAERGGFIRLDYPKGTGGHDSMSVEVVLKPRPRKT